MPEQTGSENVLSRRLNKVLQTRLENDNETLQALKQLSTFYTDNTLQTRRNLRSQIERRSLDINESFLRAFREVKESFDDVYKDIGDMRTGLLSMSTRLHSAQTHTRQLLNQTAHLQQAEGRNSAKERIVNAVQRSVLLTSDDVRALHGGETWGIVGEVGVDIFRALDKVEEKIEDAQTLIEEGCVELGQDALENLTLHKEKALDRLYKWTLQHCRNVQRNEFTEIVIKAMQRIETKPLWFKQVIQEYVVSRRGHFVAEFIDALTRGGPAGNPAPIESRAHDPQVYVTDVLVWIQRTLPVERRGLTLLLSACDNAIDSTILEEALANICEGICHPLKIRIEKTLTAAFDASVLYSLTNLIRYYKKMIAKICSSGELGATLDALELRGESAFLGKLESRVSGRLAKVETPGRDLAPTAALHGLLAHLRDLLSSASMTEARESDMNKIAGCVVDPLLRAVSEQAARLPPTDMAAYTLNCMYAMHTCLSLYQFQERRLERLTAQSEAQLDTLTSAQASALVANLSLSAIYTILQEGGSISGGSSTPLSTIPGMEPSNLKHFMIRFNAAVSKPDSLLIPQINLLASSQHKKAVQKRSFLVLLAIYKQLYDAVHNPGNLYDNPESILSITPEKLSTMINN